MNRYPEPLVFERGSRETSGVDLPSAGIRSSRLGKLERETPPDLPGLTEPEAVRHYGRLARLNHAIDDGLYPLGSCTMKYNPRLHEALARLPGFVDVHPLQPAETVQGTLEVMLRLSQWLKALTGMSEVSLSPAAGAQGEQAGLLAIRAALARRGEEDRRIVLIPDSAHGTNPASAAMCGFENETIPSGKDGRVDTAALSARLKEKGPRVAALMLTSPNTCGLFETDMMKMARDVHGIGGYMYMDGANYNALMGQTDVAALGVDAMHLNLHKTFSTPHGGGGPGAGPVVFAESLAAFAPGPRPVRDGTRIRMVDGNVGRLRSFHGQVGVIVRALAYLLAMGGDGLRQASADAVLSANYIKARLEDVISVPFSSPCMHEVLFDDRFLEGTGLSTMDVAKALIDAGMHPMTVYFPLVVRGAMLVEPTETEPKRSLDRFIDVMRDLASSIRSGDFSAFEGAPNTAPRRRLDETLAARAPRLVHDPETPDAAGE